MCGEKTVANAAGNVGRGSPPHVRGKDVFVHYVIDTPGITPACAGKRKFECVQGFHKRDHPRMCGEKSGSWKNFCAMCGSPPHVRGKASTQECYTVVRGITPACAGKRLKRSRSTVPHAAIVPLFPSVCNKPAGSDGSPAGHDAPPFLPIENAAPASPAYNLRSL